MAAKTIPELEKSMKSMFNEMSEQVNKRFEQVDKRFEQVDKRFEQVDKRFEQVDKRIEQVEERLVEVYEIAHKNGGLVKQVDANLYKVGEVINNLVKKQVKWEKLDATVKEHGYRINALEHLHQKS